MNENYDYEKAVIGALLIDPDSVLPIIRARLTDESFKQSIPRAIFKSAVKLADEGRTVDPVTIASESGASSEYLASAMTETPTAANVKAHIDCLIEQNMRVGILELIDDIPSHVKESPKELCAYLQDEINRVSSQQTEADIITSSEMCSAFYDKLSKVAAGEVKPALSTGYPDIDEILGGMLPEGLYILAARPGGGKTSLGLQIADRVARTDTPTLFVSLEMSNDQLTARRVSVLTGIPLYNIVNAKLEDWDWDKVSDGMDVLSKRPLQLNRRRSASVEDIGFMARQVKGLGFVVIDYLGLIKGNERKSLYEKTTDISNKLKRLAMQLGVPILVLAQLNREVEARGSDSEPRLSDLRDSGAIEQDADGVMLLSGLTQTERENCTDGTVPAKLTLIIAKNRHGALGRVTLNWYLHNGRIVGKEFHK